MDESTSLSIMERYDQLCTTYPDIQVTRWILGEEKAQEWLHSVGICRDPMLKSLVPPVPPLDLRKIVAAPEPEIFLWTGYVDSQQIMRIFRQYGGGENPSILDFGCGCGRMTRFLPGAFGCDINPDLVTWCQKNLSWVNTRLNGMTPPLPYEDTSFDCIYSLSIFSHLPKKMSDIWLQDLYRILKPGGLLILTIHGATALKIIRESRVHQDLFQMSSNEADSLIHTFDNDGYIFRPYPKNVLEMAKAGDEYGNTFIHPGYVKSTWDNRSFRVESFLPGGLRGWQDIVVLRKLQALPDSE